VGGRVGRFVEVDHTAAHIVVDGTLQRRAAVGQRSVVSSADIELVIVLGGVERHSKKIANEQNAMCSPKVKTAHQP
jgi:hypothetical protein